MAMEAAAGELSFPNFGAKNEGSLPVAGKENMICIEFAWELVKASGMCNFCR